MSSQDSYSYENIKCSSYDNTAPRSLTLNLLRNQSMIQNKLLYSKFVMNQPNKKEGYNDALLLHRTLNTWRSEAVSIRRQGIEANVWMICWRMKNIYWQRWYNYRTYRIQKRKRMEYITCRGEVCRILYYLRRWKLITFHLSQFHQRVSRATYKQGKRYKNLVVFLGKLLRYLYKMKSKQLLKYWKQ